MSEAPSATNTVHDPWEIAGNLSAAVHETHTGIVMLLGDKAYKAKKPVTTDFLDFSTAERRAQACRREVELNRRLAPESYLGVGHFTDPDGGPAEPVIVMRRYGDSVRLASLVKAGEPVHHHLVEVAAAMARFHRDAERGPVIDAEGTAEAVRARWLKNIDELKAHADTVLPGESVAEVERLVTQFIAGRGALFDQRIADRRIVDGHADLLADDIFCLPDGPAMLDCLEFDDRLRYVDGVDDAAFLAMDLEFLAGPELGEYFLAEYCRLAQDRAPRALKDFYIAYRAGVRAKVDCVRVTQGDQDAAAQARRHLDIAVAHLRAGAVRLILVGGGPGTGKTTVARGLAERLGAQIISTDEVRRELMQQGAITGDAGDLDAGLYSPEKVAAVYDEVLARARRLLPRGVSVVLDGTWRDDEQRARARALAAEAAVPMVEFTCAVPLETASQRIRHRQSSTSDATPEIAAALAADGQIAAGHRLDTSRPPGESVDEAWQLCCRTT
ncbi:bifunctional aminoglycoside phosphotransferase/ATP-binding protein [Mycolicibacterium sp. XJ1819]